jgi:hypothetical protein
MKITKKRLNVLIEKYLLEQEGEQVEEIEAEKEEAKEESEDFGFSIRVLDVPIDFNVTYKDGKPIPEISSDNDRVSKLIAKIKPLDYLALSYEKMKELVGYEDEERKSLFNRLGKFIKEYDISTGKDLSPEEVFKSKKKDISYINFSLDKIKKLIS